MALRSLSIQARPRPIAIFFDPIAEFHDLIYRREQGITADFYGWPQKFAELHFLVDHGFSFFGSNEKRSWVPFNSLSVNSNQKAREVTSVLTLISSEHHLLNDLEIDTALQPVCTKYFAQGVLESSDKAILQSLLFRGVELETKLPLLYQVEIELQRIAEQ